MVSCQRNGCVSADSRGFLRIARGFRWIRVDSGGFGWIQDSPGASRASACFANVVACQYSACWMAVFRALIRFDGVS